MNHKPAKRARPEKLSKPALQRIILFRHAEAIDPSDTVTDAMRVLTPKGHKRAKQAARGLAQLIKQPAAILTSPKLRARQTADTLAKVFDVVPRTLPSLAEGPAEQVAQELLNRPEELLIVVGHEPTLSLTVDRLCGRDETEPMIELRKAGCACVDIPRESGGAPIGRLRWLMTPGSLRKLAR